MTDKKKLNEDIIKFFTEVEENLEDDIKDARALVITSGCKTYGYITFDSKKDPLDLPFCHDPECTNCNNFWIAFKEESGKHLNKKLLDEEE